MYKRVNKDSNHNEIVEALINAGYSVLDLSGVGEGCPDILVGIDGDSGKYNVLIEIKSEKGSLRPKQKEFIATWKGSTTVVRTVDEALFVCNYYKVKLL